MNPTPFILIAITIIVAVILVATMSVKTQTQNPKQPTLNPPQPEKYGYPNSVDESVPEGSILFSNHLNKPVFVKYRLGTTEVSNDEATVDVGRIDPGKSEEYEVKLPIKVPGRIDIYTIESDPKLDEGKEKLVYYTTHCINQMQKMLNDYKEFHIGQITQRVIGTHKWGTTEKSANTQGVPWVIVHNTTNRWLHLNQLLDVPPYSAIRWRGKEKYGIPLGMYFQDRDGLYPTLHYIRPYTDIYYGINSTQNQPLRGGWQTAFSSVDFGQPAFLWADGWY